MNTKRKTHFLMPGTLFVSDNPFAVSTILGSCVTLCLWDQRLKSGGINHYMLPFWNGKDVRSPKFGNIAIKKLIEQMTQIGSNIEDLQAKMFGGTYCTSYQNASTRIGEQNIILAKNLMQEYNIPIVSSNVGGIIGRKLIFHTDTGKVLLKMLSKN